MITTKGQTSDSDMATVGSGTDEAAFGSTVQHEADFGAGWDRHERTAWMWACRMELFRRLGAIVGGSVKYWRLTRLSGLSGPQRRLRRMGFYAGLMSESRGRHWKRRSQ